MRRGIVKENKIEKKNHRDMKILSYPPSTKFLQPPKNTPKPVTSKGEST